MGQIYLISMLILIQLLQRLNNNFITLTLAMNPQNCGPHIQHRHSHLWRKSMFITPRVPESNSCHKQLNEFSTTMNESWRTRNNFVKTNFSHLTRGISLKTRKSAVDDVLREQKMQTGATKSMIKSLLIDKDQLEKSRQLVEGMAKLKQMKLLTGKDLNNVKFPGVIKHEHIYNDYHTRNTNPGFSRGELGRMFCK